MNNFQTIINKLKTLLSQTSTTKVQDKDVAMALGILPSTFASMKRRDTIPYRAILDFCVKHHINANTLLFQKPINNLITSPTTIKYYDEVEAGAGGGANVFNEGFKELTLNDMLLLFLSKIDS